MNEMELKALLKEAGKETQEAGQVRVEEVRAIARGRVRRRRIVGGVSVLVVGVFAVGLMMRGGGESVSKDVPRVVENEAVPAYMASAAGLRAHIEEEAQARLDRRRAAAALAAGDVTSVKEAREAAARTMVITAPRRGELAGTQEAAAVYRRTIALFPETTSAQEARLALGQIHPEN